MKLNRIAVWQAGRRRAWSDLREDIVWWAVAAAVGLTMVTAVRAEGIRGLEPVVDEPTRRYPVAMAVVDGGETLLVANRKSGSVSVVDLSVVDGGRDEEVRNAVVAEWQVGRMLSDLAASNGGRRVFVTDEAAEALYVLQREGAGLELVGAIHVPGAPVSVTVADDGRRVFVASLWARRLTTFDVEGAADGGVELKVRGTVELPFSPRRQVLVDDESQIVVAGSFAADLAVVDVEAGVVSGRWELGGHNVRGLAVSSDGGELLTAYQVLKSGMPTTRDNVLWARLMDNVVRRTAMDDVLGGVSDLPEVGPLGGFPRSVGQFGNAGGDPSAVAMDGAGRVLVALGGVGEVAMFDPALSEVVRMPVGKRPASMAVDRARERVYVGNMYDDTISVIEPAAYDVTATIVLGEQRAAKLVERGEMLFHDARLSLHGWYSCHSCHSDGHANGKLNDNRSDGSFGAPKRVLSLLGTGDTEPWSWRGGLSDLRQQIRNSVESTMAGKALSEADIEAVAEYLRSLPPAPGVGVFDEAQDEASLARGEAIFRAEGCLKCHALPTYTRGAVFDVGLADAVGNRQFNPPSLRGVSQRGPYFHDQRAGSLEEVFTVHGHPGEREYAEEDVRDLVEFLRRL